GIEVDVEVGSLEDLEVELLVLNLVAAEILRVDGRRDGDRGGRHGHGRDEQTDSVGELQDFLLRPLASGTRFPPSVSQIGRRPGKKETSVAIVGPYPAPR